MNYPELLAPAAYESILISKPPAPLPPPKPKSPILPYKPIYGNSLLSQEIVGSFLLTCAFSIGTYCIFALIPSKRLELFPILLGILGTASCGLFFFGMVFEELRNRTSFPLRLKQYQSAMKKYAVDSENYKLAMQQYEIDLTSHHQSLKNLNDPLCVEKRRRSLIKKLLRAATPPEFEKGISAPKGVSERVFGELLISNFGDKIHLNTSLSDGKYSFFPDFTYWDKDTSVIIDIEIDEPYVGSDGRPIHYLNDVYGYKSSVDMGRNNFFLAHNWFVIRFCEEQVFRSPEKCIAFVRLVSLLAKLGQNFNAINFEKFGQIRKWDKEEAHKMALHKYRKTYIPVSLQINLPNEAL